MLVRCDFHGGSRQCEKDAEYLVSGALGKRERAHYCRVHALLYKLLSERLDLPYFIASRDALALAGRDWP